MTVAPGTRCEVQNGTWCGLPSQHPDSYAEFYNTMDSRGLIKPILPSRQFTQAHRVKMVADCEEALPFNDGTVSIEEILERDCGIDDTEKTYN
jgi:hypothetical protein